MGAQTHTHTHIHTHTHTLYLRWNYSTGCTWRMQLFNFSTNTTPSSKPPVLLYTPRAKRKGYWSSPHSPTLGIVRLLIFLPIKWVEIAFFSQIKFTSLCILVATKVSPVMWLFLSSVLHSLCFHIGNLLRNILSHCKVMGLA